MTAVATPVRSQLEATAASTSGPTRRRSRTMSSATWAVALTAVATASPASRSGVKMSVTLRTRLTATIATAMRTGAAESPRA